jgi:hypothetical protein
MDEVIDGLKKSYIIISMMMGNRGQLAGLGQSH